MLDGKSEGLDLDESRFAG